MVQHDVKTYGAYALLLMFALFFVGSVFLALCLLWNLRSDNWDLNAKSRPAVYGGDWPDESQRLSYRAALMFMPVIILGFGIGVFVLALKAV